MKVSSKPSSSSSSRTSTSKSSSVSKSKSSSSVKSTSKPSKPASAQAPKDTASVSKDAHAKPNGSVPNFKSWALSAPQAPQLGAKPVPSDPAPRVAPKPAAPDTKVETLPEVKPQTPPAEAKPATKPEPPAPPNEGGAFKKFDDASWAAAQARHTAEAAQQAGKLANVQSVANAGTKALTPLNPVAAAGGTIAFGKMAYDSYQKGNMGDAALQAGNSAALGGLTAAPLVKGGEMLAKTAGRAAPALGGALQAYQGIKGGDTFDTVSGGAKIAGAAMIATGFGAPVGSALILGSYMADLGRWGYQKWNGQ